MLPEIVQFNKWLRRKRPHISTHVHYTSDLKPMAARGKGRRNGLV